MRFLLKPFKRSGLSLFAKEALANPGAVGAVWPSSRALARNMAKQIPHNVKGLVLELGAGTGVVTHAILKRKFPHQNLRVIEQSHDLAKHLRIRFPNVQIINGDAQHLTEILKDETLPVECIISSLPLRSLPKEVVKNISHEIDSLLNPGNILVQFTYSFTDHSGHEINNLNRIYQKRIWFNTPPARIEVYQYQ